MNKEFDVSFLGLTGTIDEEVAKAMFKGNGDITKLPSDFEDLSDVDNAADIYKRAQKILKKAWDKEMRNQGIKASQSDFTKDFPPTLLKNKNAGVIAALTTELCPELCDLFSGGLFESESNESEEMEQDEDNNLFDQLLENYFQTVISSMDKAIESRAETSGTTADKLSEAKTMSALDEWEDSIIEKEMQILTTGQQAKEIFLVSKSIPQETDFSNKKENLSRIDAYRKLFHTRAKITVSLFSDYIENEELRNKAVMQASPEELAAGSAYVSDFFKTLDDVDCRITELLLQKYTQIEIAEELGIGQGTVSKHIKKFSYPYWNLILKSKRFYIFSKKLKKFNIYGIFLLPLCRYIFGEKNRRLFCRRLFWLKFQMKEVKQMQNSS